MFIVIWKRNGVFWPIVGISDDTNMPGHGMDGLKDAMKFAIRDQAQEMLDFVKRRHGEQEMLVIVELEGD